MKQALLSLVALFAIAGNAQAKTLTVDCKGGGETLELVTEIANVRDPQKIQSLVIRDTPIQNFRDISTMPIYKDGDVTLRIQFGKMLYSSVDISVQQCSDDFLATGQATLKLYVGGFAGTSQTAMQCGCSLK